MRGKGATCLVAYFSREGDNYVGGRIVRLRTGNTQAAAQMLLSMIEADAFRIRTAKDYPLSYEEATRVAQEELRRRARPELAGDMGRLVGYDTVLLGYPNWWNTMPMPVFAFLEKHDFTGKTILPFCTHEGSGLGRSVADIRGACPGAQVREGLAIPGGSVSAARPEMEKWLQKNGLLA